MRCGGRLSAIPATICPSLARNTKVGSTITTWSHAVFRPGAVAGRPRRQAYPAPSTPWPRAGPPATPTMSTGRRASSTMLPRSYYIVSSSDRLSRRASMFDARLGPCLPTHYLLRPASQRLMSNFDRGSIEGDMTPPKIDQRGKRTPFAERTTKFGTSRTVEPSRRERRGLESDQAACLPRRRCIARYRSSERRYRSVHAIRHAGGPTIVSGTEESKSPAGEYEVGHSLRAIVALPTGCVRSRKPLVRDRSPGCAYELVTKRGGIRPDAVVRDPELLVCGNVATGFIYGARQNPRPIQAGTTRQQGDARITDRTAFPSKAPGIAERRWQGRTQVWRSASTSPPAPLMS